MFSISLLQIQVADPCCGSTVNVASLLLRGDEPLPCSQFAILGESNVNAVHTRVAQPPPAVLEPKPFPSVISSVAGATRRRSREIPVQPILTMLIQGVLPKSPNVTPRPEHGQPQKTTPRLSGAERMPLEQSGVAVRCSYEKCTLQITPSRPPTPQVIPRSKGLSRFIPAGRS